MLSTLFMFSCCFTLGENKATVIDAARTRQPTLLHVDCEILIQPAINRCIACTKHLKSLTAMKARKPKDTNKTDPSSHTNLYMHFYARQKRMNDFIGSSKQEKRPS